MTVPQRDKTIAVVLAAATILAASSLLWINRPRTSPLVPDDPLLSADIDFGEVVWNPELAWGGFLGNELTELLFQHYVQSSAIIFTGRIVSVDEETFQRQVRVETRIFGEPQSEFMVLIPDGPGPDAEPGERVLIMLRERYGETRLNSFCPISGAFAYSDGFARMIIKVIKADPVSLESAIASLRAHHQSKTAPVPP